MRVVSVLGLLLLSFFNFIVVMLRLKRLIIFVLLRLMR